MVSRIDAAAINSSLAALTGSDRPSFTSRIVSPRWWKVSSTNPLDGFWHGSISGNSPVCRAVFDAATQIDACNRAGSFCTSDAQCDSSLGPERCWRGYACRVREPRTGP